MTATISPELDALSCALIDFALEKMEGGEESEPFPVLLAVDCADEVFAFADDTPDGCYRAACRQVTDLGAACMRYALAYAGFVQVEETDPGSPALLIEFAERGMECAWSGYLLYRWTSQGSLEVGDPQPGGEEELLFG